MLTPPPAAATALDVVTAAEAAAAAAAAADVPAVPFVTCIAAEAPRGFDAAAAVAALRRNLIGKRKLMKKNV